MTDAPAAASVEKPQTSRVEQLQTEMSALGIEAALLRLPENLVLTTGYWPLMAGTTLVVVPEHGDAVLLAPAHEEAEIRRWWAGQLRPLPSGRLDEMSIARAIEMTLPAVARDLGIQGATVGVEAGFELLAPPRFDGEPAAVGGPTTDLIRAAFDTESVIDLSPVLETMRQRKTSRELAGLRIANEIASVGLAAFKDAARPGRTEAEIAAAVSSAIVSRGHEYPGVRTVRAYATVCSGERTALGWQYFLHDDRRVQRDDLVMLELGTCVDGLWGDYSHTVVAGTASRLQRAAMAAVVSATLAAIDAATPGAQAHDVDAVARATVADHGFEQFPHHTGHGTGFRYHEGGPLIVPGGHDSLAAGMVLAVEPGVYVPGVGGFRWEQNAVVTDGGGERLGACAHEL